MSSKEAWQNIVINRHQLKAHVAKILTADPDQLEKADLVDMLVKLAHCVAFLERTTNNLYHRE